MPVPEFTDRGVLPEGVHLCTLLEAQQALCTNDQRAQIWEGLLGFLEWALQLPTPTALLIDGSYVTDKPRPGDVDIVVDLTSCSPTDQQTWFQAWHAGHDFVKGSFNVDFYPFVIGAGNDFSVYFQYIRVEEALRRGIPPHIRKGILRVEQQ